MDERERKMLEESHEKSNLLHRIFMEPHVPNEPTLLERLSASMKFVERQSWASKWLIRAILTIPVFWAIITIVREIAG